MKKISFKSQLYFNRGERVGILLLLGTILSLLYFYFFILPTSESSLLDISSPEIKALQAKIDSLHLAETENRKPKVYPFNPNFITDYKAYVLGMNPVEFDRLQKYREQGSWINSVSQFKEVTGVSDSLIAIIGPKFKFPGWINATKRKRSYTNFKKAKTPLGERIDLNLATLEQLQTISGIGSALSQRIIKRREQFGGFNNDLQLYDVWGLKPEVVQRLLEQFTVKTPKEVKRLNINNASASDLATVPGISFGLGKKIWEFVRLREGLTHISELKKIEEITPRKFQLIELYLYAE